MRASASVSTAAHARASSTEFSMGTFSSIHLNTSSCSTEFTSIQSSNSPAAQMARRELPAVPGATV